MLGTRVTKYYHAAKIREDKREKLNTQNLGGNPSTDKGKKPRGKSREFLLSGRNYKTSL